MSQIIMSAKVNGAHILNGMEQGRVIHSSRLHLYYKLNMKDDTQKWTLQNYGLTFKVEGHESYDRQHELSAKRMKQ